MESLTRKGADFDSKLLACLSFPEEDQNKFSCSTSKLPKTIVNSFPGHGDRKDLGTLHILPLEMLREILPLLPYPAIRAFANVNSCARDHVVALPIFQDVVGHAAELLIALRDREIIHHFAIIDIHKVLTTSSCKLCGEFGPHCSLLNLVRCCKECIVKEERLQLISLTEARELLMCNPDDLRQLPQLSLPQIGAKNKAPLVFNGNPLDLEQLPLVTEGIRMSRGTYYTLSGIDLKPKSEKYVNLGSARKFAHADPQTANETKAKYFQDILMNKPSKDWVLKSSAIYLPYLDMGTHTRVFGTRCLGCKEDWRKHAEWDLTMMLGEDADPANRIYSKSEFAEHVKSCEHAATMLRNGTCFEVLKRFQDLGMAKQARRAL